MMGHKGTWTVGDFTYTWYLGERSPSKGSIYVRYDTARRTQLNDVNI